MGAIEDELEILSAAGAIDDFEIARLDDGLYLRATPGRNAPPDIHDFVAYVLQEFISRERITITPIRDRSSGQRRTSTSLRK